MRRAVFCFSLAVALLSRLSSAVESECSALSFDSSAQLYGGINADDCYVFGEISEPKREDESISDYLLRFCPPGWEVGVVGHKNNSFYEKVFGPRNTDFPSDKGYATADRSAVIIDVAVFFANGSSGFVDTSKLQKLASHVLCTMKKTAVSKSVITTIKPSTSETEPPTEPTASNENTAETHPTTTDPPVFDYTEPEDEESSNSTEPLPVTTEPTPPPMPPVEVSSSPLPEISSSSPLPTDPPDEPSALPEESSETEEGSPLFGYIIIAFSGFLLFVSGALFVLIFCDVILPSGKKPPPTSQLDPRLGIIPPSAAGAEQPPKSIAMNVSDMGKSELGKSEMINLTK